MGNLLKTKGGLVIDRPGHVLFVPVKADGSLDYSNSIRNQSPINTITVTNSKTTTDIPDGNSSYPAGSRVTAIAGTVAVEFSTIDPAIWAMCSGTELKETATDTMIKLYEYEKIGDNATIELDGKYKTDGFIQVIGSDGTVYEKNTSTAGAGEFSAAVEGNKTTLTFNTSDKGKDVMVSMAVEAKTASYSQGKKAMRNHKIIIATEYSTLGNTDKIPVNVEISQASITGDMADTLQKDPSATKTLTFNMYAPLAGEQPYQIKFGVDDK